MPDPTGANLTDAEVKRIEFADPLFQEFKLADRLQEMRADHESGELSNSMSLTLTAAHTLVEPQGTAAAAETEITGSVIVATADGAYDLTLPAAADYKGMLVVFVKNGSSTITVKSPAGGSGQEVEDNEKGMFFSDGSDWYTDSTPDAADDLGA